MTSRPEELEQFKTEIDLRLFAADFGFQIDPKGSSASGTVMRDASGTKIRVTRGTDGHYVYWNAHDELDSGSIVDFIQKRTGANLGQVRLQLRPWVGGTAQPVRVPRSAELPPLVPIKRDIAAVQALADGMAELDSGHHPYLNDRRGLSPELLADPRFSGSIRIDGRGNAAFIHINRDGTCGFELKNYEFTGFSKAGAKGLWASGCHKSDRVLVVAESAIDGLSYAGLHGHENARFVSTSGQPSDEQIDLVRAAFAKLDEAAHVVLALDNDDGGDHLAELFTAIWQEERDRSPERITTQRPASRGFDWNDALLEALREPEPPSPT